MNIIVFAVGLLDRNINNAQLLLYVIYWYNNQNTHYKQNIDDNGVVDEILWIGPWKIYPPPPGKISAKMAEILPLLGIALGPKFKSAAESADSSKSAILLAFYTITYLCCLVSLVPWGLDVKKSNWNYSRLMVGAGVKRTSRIFIRPVQQLCHPAR